jgi:hypothetical protein
VVGPEQKRFCTVPKPCLEQFVTDAIISLSLPSDQHPTFSFMTQNLPKKHDKTLSYLPAQVCDLLEVTTGNT